MSLNGYKLSAWYPRCPRWWTLNLFLVAVAVRDEPGTLAWVTRHLAKWHLNLKGFVVDPAGMQLLVTDIHTLSIALGEMGLIYRVTEVREVVLDDRAGALAEVAERLADEGINICTAFGLATGAAARIYLDVQDIERAAPILEAFNKGRSLVHGQLGRIGPITR